MIVIQCITANFAQIMTWRFTGEDLAEENFPSGCCPQHCANTDTSKMQLTTESSFSFRKKNFAKFEREPLKQCKI